MRRAGFTLIEILVSIAIFAVASAFMFGALFGATEVFRRGEAARQAGDEATAVVAAVQEDLARVVPFRLRDGKPAPEWGRIRAAVADAAGNCHLSLVIENPDRSQVRWVDENGDGTMDTVTGVRQRVDWFVIPGDESSAHCLIRKVWDLGDGGQLIDAIRGSDDPYADTDRVTALAPHRSVDPSRRDIITSGVLHFGTWLEVAQAHRLVKPAAGGGGADVMWEDATDAVLPFAGDAASGFAGQLFDTGELITAPPPAFYPQPDAIRVTLVLTGGGRFATRGTFIADAGGDRWRISGIKALPTVTGSLLRVGNEWVRYDSFRDGVLGGVQRGQLRSDGGGAHGRGDLVLAGMFFSLVAPLPR